MLTQFKRLFWKVSLLTTSTSLMVVTITSAAPSNRSASFDDDGPTGKPKRSEIVFNMMGQSNSEAAAKSLNLAAPGQLDTTFDSDGRVVTDVNAFSPGRSDIIYDVAIQSNGKILAAGYSYAPATNIQDFAVTRYNTNGGLDTTFTGDGKLITNLGGLDVAYNVVVQPNGKIVVSGEVCNSPATIGGCDVAVVRYNPGGGLDTTFSGDGKVLTDFGNNDNGSIGGLALQTDGKIVVAGYMWNGTNYDFAVYRYLTGGTLDTTFSGDGLQKIDFGPGRRDFGTVVAIQPDGKIIVLGYSGDSEGNNNDFAVVRLKSNGALDLTYSGDGRQITDMGANDFLWGFAGQADGRFVTVGTSSTASFSRIAVARFKASCAPPPDTCLDTTFDGDGKKVFALIAGVSAFGGDAVIQSDGKILVTGGTASDFALVRMKSNGAFDTVFNGTGKLTIDFFGGDEFAWIVRRQAADGKYVLGGYTWDGSQYDFALARVLP